MSDSPNDWDFFYCTRDNADASIAVNLGLRKFAPDARRPCRLSVWLKINSPTDKGMNSTEERPLLDRISDALEAAICPSCDAVFVGRMIRGGYWTFHYYAPESGRFAGKVNEVMTSFPTYSCRVASSDDPEWSAYVRGLLPSAREMQQILNRRVLDNLKRHGDDLRRSRNISHWVYFRNSFDRAQFLNRLSDSGFVSFESELPDDDRREFRLCARVSRTDSVDFDSIQETVLFLFDLADECGGSYDGWETQVIKAGELPRQP